MIFSLIVKDRQSMGRTMYEKVRNFSESRACEDGKMFVRYMNCPLKIEAISFRSKVSRKIRSGSPHT